MSIRRVNKDHLKEHAGVAPAERRDADAPEADDPLSFWTRHPTEPVLIELHEFADGRPSKDGGKGAKYLGFSGRPKLIEQLLPAIKESWAYFTDASVANTKNALRDWWRLLDAVEQAAARSESPMTRVEDVRLLSNMHAQAAKAARMPRTKHGVFRRLADVTLLALGEAETHWESPENETSLKHLPPEAQRKELRIAVRRECRKVMEAWDNYDALKSLRSPPEDAEQQRLWKCVNHMRSVQERTGVAVPSSSELNNGHHRQWVQEAVGGGLRLLRATAFPTSHDAEAVWTQCLINTPWNPSTLLSLDASQRFLFDHFKDDPTDPHRRWVLVGQKERAGGRDQILFGMWKTMDAPGHLIRTYMARVQPLREALAIELNKAETRYRELQLEDSKAEAANELFKEIVRLRQGCRSVWLFVNQTGTIDWLTDLHHSQTGNVNGKVVSYLDEVRHSVNEKLSARGAKLLPKVTPKDFRLWFADYIYRSSRGNILAVKAALNHSLFSTSVGYVNTNVRNQEASDAARKFLDILVDELDAGRLDLTILAHLYRHGALTPEQEQCLSELRALPKSRQGVGCKDPLNPPPHLGATAGKACDVQRCLLCAQHAVLLPESLDGIAMREAELKVLQSCMPATTWAEASYDVELENHKLALRRYDLNQVLEARARWRKSIVSGEHVVPGIPASATIDIEVV